MSSGSLATATLEIRLAGSPGWRQPGQAAWRNLSRKDAALLAVLALDGPQPRDRLAGLLWPEVPQSRANANLRQRLFRLRHDTLHTVCDVGEQVSLQPDVAVDLTASADDAINAPTDELMSGCDFAHDGEALDEWVQQARQRWLARRIDALSGCAARQETAGELAAALATVERLLALDPLQEHGWRRLMRLHERRGDRAAAVAAFERCERVLKDELGLAPSAETQEQLLGIEQAGVSATGLPPWLNRPPERLGREREWGLMASAWSGERPFLLVGDAGVGKSRLLADWAAAHPGALLESARPGDEPVPYGTLVRVLRHAPRSPCSRARRSPAHTVVASAARVGPRAR